MFSKEKKEKILHRHGAKLATKDCPLADIHGLARRSSHIVSHTWRAFDLIAHVINRCKRVGKKSQIGMGKNNFCVALREESKT
jgi:hypothetical protein